MSRQHFDYSYDKNDKKQSPTNPTSSLMQRIQDGSDRNRANSEAPSTPASSFTYRGAQQQAVASSSEHYDKGSFYYQSPTNIQAQNTYQTAARYTAPSSSINKKPQHHQPQQHHDYHDYYRSSKAGDQKFISSHSNSSLLSSRQPISNRNTLNDFHAIQQSSTIINSKNSQYAKSVSQESSNDGGAISNTDQYSFLEDDDEIYPSPCRYENQQNYSNDNITNQSQSMNQRLQRETTVTRVADINHSMTNSHDIDTNQYSSPLSQLSQSSPRQTQICNYSRTSMPPSKSDTLETSYYDEGQSSLADSHSMSSSSTVTTIVNSPINSKDTRHSWKHSASASSASLQSSPSHSVTTISSSLYNPSHGEDLQQQASSVSDRTNGEISLENQFTTLPSRYPFVRQQASQSQREIDDLYRSISASISPTPSTSSLLMKRNDPSSSWNQYPLTAHRTRSASSIGRKSNPAHHVQHSQFHTDNQNLRYKDYLSVVESPSNLTTHISIGTANQDQQSHPLTTYDSSQSRSVPSVSFRMSPTTRNNETAQKDLNSSNEKYEQNNGLSTNYSDDISDLDKLNPITRPHIMRSISQSPMSRHKQEKDKLRTDFFGDLIFNDQSMNTQALNKGLGQNSDSPKPIKKSDNLMAYYDSGNHLLTQDATNRTNLLPGGNKYYIENKDATMAGPAISKKEILDTWIDNNQEQTMKDYKHGKDDIVTNSFQPKKQFTSQTYLQSTDDDQPYGKPIKMSSEKDTNKKSPTLSDQSKLPNKLVTKPLGNQSYTCLDQSIIVPNISISTNQTIASVSLDKPNSKSGLFLYPEAPSRDSSLKSINTEPSNTRDPKENIQMKNTSSLCLIEKNSPGDAASNDLESLKKQLEQLRNANSDLQKKVDYLEKFRSLHGNKSPVINQASSPERFREDSIRPDSIYQLSHKGCHNPRIQDMRQTSSDEQLENIANELYDNQRRSSTNKCKSGLATDRGINWTRNRSKSVGYSIGKNPFTSAADSSDQEVTTSNSRKVPGSLATREKYGKSGGKKFPWFRVKEALGWVNQQQMSNNTGEPNEDLLYSITVDDVVYDEDDVSVLEQSDPDDIYLKGDENQRPQRTTSNTWNKMKTMISPTKRCSRISDQSPSKAKKSKKISAHSKKPCLMNEQFCESNIDTINPDFASEVTTMSECSDINDNSSRDRRPSQESLLYEKMLHQEVGGVFEDDPHECDFRENIKKSIGKQQVRNDLGNQKRPKSFRSERTFDGAYTSSGSGIHRLLSHQRSAPHRGSSVHSTASSAARSPAQPQASFVPSSTNLIGNANSTSKSSRWKQMKRVFVTSDSNQHVSNATIDASLSSAQPSPSSISTGDYQFTYELSNQANKVDGCKVLSRPHKLSSDSQILKSDTDTSTADINKGDVTNRSNTNSSPSTQKCLLLNKESSKLDAAYDTKFVPLSMSKSTPVANMVHELQKNLSNDFSKKIQEWEKKRSVISDYNSPAAISTRNVKKSNIQPNSRKEQYNLQLNTGHLSPSRSRSVFTFSGRDISSHSIDSGTSNNLSLSNKAYNHKVNWLDKELQKIQKEIQKLRNEELRYEERAARLIKLRDSVLRGDIVTDKKEVFVRTPAGEFRFEGISQDFTKKLYEWETKKNVKMDMSTIALLDNVQSLDQSSPSTTKSNRSNIGSSRSKKKRTNTKQKSSARDSSPDDNYYCWLDENMFLLDQLRSKEEICRRLEGELNKLDEGMNKMNRQHELEMEKYRQKLWEIHKLRSNPKDMETSIKLMTELKGKIDELQACGERLKNDKQALEDSFRYHSQQQAHLTIDLIEKMRDLQQLTYNKCGLQNSSQDSNSRNQKRSYIKCDVESLCKLHELSTQLMDQARNLENRLAERTSQICQLRWELIDSDVRAMRIQTELESLKWQTSKRAALRRSRYGQKRSWSSSERLFHRVVELDESEARSTHCDLGASPCMKSSGYEFEEFPSSDLSDWLKVDEESGSISDTVQLLKLELLKIGALDKDSVAGGDNNSVQSGNTSTVGDQTEERPYNREREESDLRLQELTSIASESSEASGVAGLNDSLAEKEAYVIRLPRKRVNPKSIVSEIKIHNLDDEMKKISRIDPTNNVISSSSDSQSLIEEDINHSWDMRSSTTCDPPTTTNTTNASIVATSSDSNNSLDSSSIPQAILTKSVSDALILSLDQPREENGHPAVDKSGYLCSMRPSSSKSNNDMAKGPKFCSEYYKSRQVFVKLTEGEDDKRLQNQR